MHRRTLMDTPGMGALGASLLLWNTGSALAQTLRIGIGRFRPGGTDACGDKGRSVPGAFIRDERALIC
jgi:hypothetical protein